MNEKKLVNTSGAILINKSAATVFDFFANPVNDPHWRKEINRSLSEGPLQRGMTVSEYSYLSKKVSDNLIELKCVVFEKNKIAVFETAEGAPFYLKSQRMIKAVSDHHTEVGYTLQFDKSIVKFAMGFNLPDFVVSMKANYDMKKYLRELKKLLESHS